MKKNINVIGGSGFIGSRLVKLLKENDNFHIKIIDKIHSKMFHNLTEIGDVRKIEDLQNCISENSVIINLAAEHRDDVQPISLYDEVNVDGAKNICSIANEKKVNTIIFTSSVAVYGFAPIGTNESGKIAPFNDYGRTKFLAEEVFRAWQLENPKVRSLVIIRPTVVFGEMNRGNVYNLLKHIASGKFVMIGKGENRKSMAYVENVAAFILYSLNFKPGIHTFNYIDKPDFTMNNLISNVNKILGRTVKIKFSLPYILGYLIANIFDITSIITGKKFTISSIRVKKFCTDSVYNSCISQTGFIPPISLENALLKTIKYEFIDVKKEGILFFSE